ncbi:uncharacterized protein LACBIDRAFT_298858 [Laccaria bicolor S238N-H82]|uniref:Predicted protein n=1 Tax=Laccaria bicolor (strain S238N-H82 / ATCC MYA-4686) TaxID=486041 RepID=B0DE66_LACBS|nr:uncharacterized protein LACBIDRAFT_298858 [Laccaria bicolor S238N-H82]EDR07087.1 predicted protein [Laccaria bicolor S238N-H82]|eukprot:XP_001882018.1 predicted protein [Laccaria bicolor S238N-H82]
MNAKQLQPASRSHKFQSHIIKKSKKNQLRPPRTAGLRTLSELTQELTKAGLDPSSVQECADERRCLLESRVPSGKSPERSMLVYALSVAVPMDYSPACPSTGHWRK